MAYRAKVDEAIFGVKHDLSKTEPKKVSEHSHSKKGRGKGGVRVKTDEAMFGVKHDLSKTEHEKVSEDRHSKKSKGKGGLRVKQDLSETERKKVSEVPHSKKGKGKGGLRVESPKPKAKEKIVTVEKVSEEEEEEEEGEEEEDDDDDMDSEMPPSSIDDWFPGLSTEEKERRASELAKALLEASLQRPDDELDAEEVGEVREEDQKSLAVGIIGAPNAGKSTLTNYMVGTKVAAVSRKTNTTTHEILGVMTKGDTQILFFDTPGVMLSSSGRPYSTDVTQRSESAWRSLFLYDVLLVMIDARRHLERPDPRVISLVKKLGENVHPKQKRVLCMNKVDLIEVKKDLLKVAGEFGHLPGYDEFYMISGMRGSGVKDLVKYLMEQAVKRPWDEDPMLMDEEYLKSLSLEVVREKMLDCIHQEIPYVVDQRLIDWKPMRDGSVRIEQHFIVTKLGHRKILVGKNGSKIRQIGMAANEELRKLLKRTVHLIIQVRVKK
jgi:GTP-binding protein Era